MESIAEEWFESDIKSNSDQPYLAFILLAKPHSHRGFEALAQFYIDKEMDMCDLIDLLEDERDVSIDSIYNYVLNKRLIHFILGTSFLSNDKDAAS